MIPTITRLTLREAAPPQQVRLPERVAAELARLKIASVVPLGGGEWLVSGVSKVGALTIGETELRIEPKVPLRNLFFLVSRTLGWDEWRSEVVELSSIDEFFPAIAELFARSAERVLAAGVLRSYREHRAAETFVRGRWLVSEQIRKRHGLPLPAELAYDEFTADIAENRMLRSAAARLLRLPGIRPSLRRRLYRVEGVLAEVERLTPGIPLPRVSFDRRNQRYRPALALARLILEDASLERGIADVTASGFLLSMPALFERFVEVEVTRAAIPFGGAIVSQRRDYLDRDAQVVVKPDLVWLMEGEIAAVFDAKYKAEKPAGYPNADIYQMLAYCVRHGRSEGHLIYAAGNEIPSEYVVEQAGVTVVCHAIDLAVSPALVLSQIDGVLGRAVTPVESLA